MANNTTINSELFTNLLAEAQFAAYENSVARAIATAFDFPSNAGKTLQIPVYAGVAAVPLTEGSAPSAADTNTTSVDITVSEIGTYFQVTDMLRDSAARDVMADLGMQAGRALAEKMDSNLFGLFSSFTTDVGPGAGGEVTVDHLLKAAATLRKNKLTGPFVAVLHPFQAYNVKKQLSNAGGSNVPALSNAGNNVMDGFYIGSVAGIQVYESGLISLSGTDAVGAVFAKSALATVMRGGISMESQRQAAARATDIMISAVVGQGILQDAHGVKLTGDAAL